MNVCNLLIPVLSLALLLPNRAGAAPKPGNPNEPGRDVDKALASVSLPELPVRAAQLVREAKPKDRETVALAAVDFTARTYPTTLPSLVNSVARALPESAAAVAAAAVKLVPEEGSYISRAAISAAPGFGEQINRAVAAVYAELEREAGRKPDGGPPQVPPGLDKDKDGQPGNRPEVPPGLEKKLNSIRGNRPTTPPGHVRNPWPGRDPKRNDYATP